MLWLVGEVLYEWERFSCFSIVLGFFVEGDIFSSGRIVLLFIWILLIEFGIHRLGYAFSFFLWEVATYWC